MRHDSYSSEYLSPPVKRQQDLKYQEAKAIYELSKTTKRMHNLKELHVLTYQKFCRYSCNKIHEKKRII